MVHDLFTIYLCDKVLLPELPGYTSKMYTNHGPLLKEMNGNSCRDVLKKLDSLHSELEKEYSDLLVFVEALSAFEHVIISCFGDELLVDRYENDIAVFKEYYMKLGIPMCVKPHILFDHVPVFCQRRGAMGYWSEQAGFVYY